MTTGNEGVRIGVRFIRWGLGLLIFGIFIGFGIIGHYLIGAQYNTGHMFLENVTLWFACPWTLAARLQGNGAGRLLRLSVSHKQCLRLPARVLSTRRI
ncbi:hypothetical protein [Edaphobacter aggregans]|uniref:hypothetical protein n=1 Tax=Edaphobacter aggregans TaxID=570835 RepID=UPI0005524019|nr:hypothetical protein [Edaphobacter aggregans]